MSEKSETAEITLANLIDRYGPSPEGIPLSTTLIAKTTQTNLQIALNKAGWDGRSAADTINYAQIEVDSATENVSIQNDFYLRNVPQMRDLERRIRAAQPKANEIRAMLPPYMQADFMSPDHSLMPHIKNWMKKSEEAGVELTGAELRLAAAAESYKSIEPSLQ